MFEVGEIVIGQNFITSPNRNGMECEIVGSLKMHKSYNRIRGAWKEAVGHEVKWSDGKITYQESHYLRKKKPPEELSNWEEIQKLTNWSPTKQGIEV